MRARRAVEGGLRALDLRERRGGGAVILDFSAAVVDDEGVERRDWETCTLRGYYIEDVGERRKGAESAKGT